MPNGTTTISCHQTPAINTAPLVITECTSVLTQWSKSCDIHSFPIIIITQVHAWKGLQHNSEMAGVKSVTVILRFLSAALQIMPPHDTVIITKVKKDIKIVYYCKKTLTFIFLVFSSIHFSRLTFSVADCNSWSFCISTRWLTKQLQQTVRKLIKNRAVPFQSLTAVHLLTHTPV